LTVGVDSLAMDVVVVNHFTIRASPFVGQVVLLIREHKLGSERAIFMSKQNHHTVRQIQMETKTTEDPCGCKSKQTLQCCGEQRIFLSGKVTGSQSVSFIKFYNWHNKTCQCRYKEIAIHSLSFSTVVLNRTVNKKENKRRKSKRYNDDDNKNKIKKQLLPAADDIYKKYTMGQ
ncbi:conserved hypothetical protein, partial [Trichinella spiralis]|uniref:hypothetical protein n=1 Tax=Trichinella spiralis TaxID=6334 RepID=UPI0001EFDAC8